MISVGTYSACAGLIRDARDAAWDVPIANVSGVDSENLLRLLIDTGRTRGKDYTRDIINSQVVPSYSDTSLPAVREYRELMDRYKPMPPRDLLDEDYAPPRYSFISLEGYLNARLLVEVLRRMGPDLRRSASRRWSSPSRTSTWASTRRSPSGPASTRGWTRSITPSPRTVAS